MSKKRKRGVRKQRKHATAKRSLRRAPRRQSLYSARLGNPEGGW